MTLIADVKEVGSGPTGDAGAPWPPRLLVLGVVALVASPVVVAALALVGEPWYPIGDFAHMVFRTSQVGTGDTPLVGAYAVKGWAHPGPLLFWLSAPLYRLTGSDPRAVEWTTAIVNVVCIAALARVAWRRGGPPFLLAVGTATALLLHGLGPHVLVSVWNPLVPLLPFLLTVLLVWDAALGRRRSLAWAVVPASIAMQGHLAFVALVALVAVWLVAWCRWSPRLLPEAPPGSEAEAGTDTEPGGGSSWSSWYPILWRGLLIGCVLWIGPIVDLVADQHNPITVLKGLASPPATVGPLNAVGLVGRYVRPDGPWIGGAEPQSLNLSVQGSGPLPFLVAAAAVAGCLVVARRRRLVDVAALASAVLVLLAGSVPATSQIVLPAFHYLTQWLKVVGCLVWLTVAWTAWRVAEPHVRATVTRQRVVAACAGGLLVGTVAISWGDAAAMEQPMQRESVAVQDLRAQLADVLPRDKRIRIESRGDYAATTNPGLIYWLIEDGFDVVANDGHLGLKWGHDHRWVAGDDYDVLVTIARNRTATECAADPEARHLAFYDGMSVEERSWYSELQLRQLSQTGDVTAAERERATELAKDNLRIGVFEGPDVCAANPRWEARQTTDGSVLPVLAGVAGIAAVLVGGLLLRRRRPRVGRSHE